jgi:hypothetical protein
LFINQRGEKGINQLHRAKRIVSTGALNRCRICPLHLHANRKDDRRDSLDDERYAPCPFRLAVDVSAHRVGSVRDPVG